MSKSRQSAVTAINPVTIPAGGIRYAPGVRAGRWVFATGHKGVADYTQGMSAAVMRETAPHWDKPKLRREAEQIFRNAGAVLKAGGSNSQNIVRVDQNYTSGRAVEAYHDARRAILKNHIPPSTSTLVQGFVLPGQDIEVHMMAIVPTDDFRPRHIRPADQEVHHTSGYSLALAAGDYVFVAGRMADSFTFGEGLAAAARMPDGHLWKGLPIKLQADFIIREKLIPTLKTAGSSLQNIVKCQVYMRDIDDFAAFNEVWASYFPRGQPATTLIPTATPGFFLSDARIEINTIALLDAGRTRKQIIEAGVATPFAGYTQAVRAGDLLLISGMMAADRNGLIAGARVNPAQPYFGSSIQAQMDYLLASAQTLCKAAGTSLANVVRIQQDRKSTRLNSSHVSESRMPSSA